MVEMLSYTCTSVLLKELRWSLLKVLLFILSKTEIAYRISLISILPRIISPIDWFPPFSKIWSKSLYKIMNASNSFPTEDVIPGYYLRKYGTS